MSVGIQYSKLLVVIENLFEFPVCGPKGAVLNHKNELNYCVNRNTSLCNQAFDFTVITNTNNVQGHT